MPLTSSGQISLNDLHVEAGGTTGTQASMNDADIRGLLGAAANSQMTFSSFYGASAGIGQIASGNSSYVLGANYEPSVWRHSSVKSDMFGSTTNEYVANTPRFKLGNNDTEYLEILYLTDLRFRLFDFSSTSSQLGATNTSSLPSNSGWTTLKIKNASGTVVTSVTRASATYGAIQSQRYNGSTTVFPFVAQWIWQVSNPFPNSNNTTLFTVELE